MFSALNGVTVTVNDPVCAQGIKYFFLRRKYSECEAEIEFYPATVAGMLGEAT